MKIELFVQTAFQQNTRVVSCERTGKAICIDPGEPSPDVVEYIRINEYDLIAIVLTHGHLDHIGGTACLHREFPESHILLHEYEEPLYTSLPRQPLMMGIPPHQMAMLGMDYGDPPRPTRYLVHGDVLEVGDLRFGVRHCPGHTPGHIVLAEENEKVVFTGDCLFSGTIGRTDLPGGDSAELLESIEMNIMSLSDEFVIKCGHGPDTTVGRERSGNPFLTGLYQIGRR